MRWIIAYLAGIASSVVSATLMGFLFKGLSREVAFTSLFIGLTICFYIFKHKERFLISLENKKLDFWSIFTIVIFILFSLKAYLWLIYKVGDSIRISSPNNLGDISLHINYIQYLANDVSFWPDNSIFVSGKTQYPIGIDLFNSLLVLIGVDLFCSLIWVGLIGALATGFALFTWGRAFALAGFLFNGGLAGFTFFQTFTFADYQSELAWKSIPLTMLITQRGLLYALPAGLLLLSSWRYRFFNTEGDSKEDSKVILPLWIEVLLYSSMPIFHVHTFIFLSLLLGIWFFLLNLQRSQILKLIILSIPLASFFVLLLTDFLRTSSLIYIKLGWMQGNENFLLFWLLNFGIFLPLVIFLSTKLIQSREKRSTSLFVFPAVVLFILFCNVMMAPWVWDNAKLLIWSYLILLPFLWNDLISSWNKIVKIIVCFILFFSGFICICGGFPESRGYELFKPSEVTQVREAIKNLPVEHRFAAFPTYNHPLIYCGRKVVFGYPGWIWSHGYKTKDLEEKFKQLMLGTNNWHKLAQELRIKYLFWGYRESQEYRISTRPWESTSNIVASGSWGAIYDIEGNKIQR